MTRTLLLDLDGTLVDSVPDLAPALNRRLAAHGLPPYSLAEVAAMVGDGAAALVRRAFAGRGGEALAADIAAFVADYTAHATEHTKVYEGVPEMLATAAGQGWRLAVCTNKPVAPARALLAHLGLLEMFAAIGGGDSFLSANGTEGTHVRKPDPRHLLLTLSEAGGDPARALMMGDHRNDLLAADGAGLPCVFAAWGYSPRSVAAGAAAIAERPLDVPEILAALSPPPAAGFTTP